MSTQGSWRIPERKLDPRAGWTILTFPDKATATGEIAERYPHLRVVCMCDEYLSDSNEFCVCPQNTRQVVVYLAPRKTTMTPEVREKTREFYEACGFGVYPLRRGYPGAETDSLIEELLAQNVRPCDLALLSKDEFDQLLQAFVEGPQNRQTMYASFRVELAKEPE